MPVLSTLPLQQQFTQNNSLVKGDYEHEGTATEGIQNGKSAHCSEGSNVYVFCLLLFC